MRKEVKVLLKEVEEDDNYKKGDPIVFKKLKGVVIFTTHYIIVAEFEIYNWIEKLKKYWRGK